MIKEKLKQIKEGKWSAEQNIRSFLENIKESDKAGKKINAFLQLNDNALLEAKEVDSKLRRGKAPAGKLAGLAIAVKANINVKNMFASCASKTLENYKACYDASVIEKIRKEDGIIIGIANMDEFAAGSSGETSAFGETKNPACLDRIPGGSSSGPAAAVAAGFCDLALGSDTGGSIRNPASHCGVVGMKPSYGVVSRYGLIDLSMSLEQIGTLAKDVEGAELLFDVIKGKDERDTTTYDVQDKKEKIGKIKIGIPKIKADERIWKLVREKVKEICEREGWKAEDVEIKYIDLGVQTYYPINYVEFFSSTRRYDGRKYGKKIEENCGEEVLRRILGGQEIAQAEYAGKYYRKALQAKKLIEEEFAKALKGFDCLIMPTVPRLPHKLGEKISIEDMYMYDTLTVLANLAGVPAISVPCGKIDGIPVGMQIICGKFEEGKMFEISKMFFKDIHF
ncbi:MAG: Asp-tRNA(Asn)/Glu-tRNA(Gln) amidotransferase subunit GatA [Nanoarchaeota archaeon]|nr:Asp-tRNA(Asn)/Glu-tRNA(Gln) amidotransferase subunit GatA [Nanoarchaeota archaeon]